MKQILPMTTTKSWFSAKNLLVFIILFFVLILGITLNNSSNLENFLEKKTEEYALDVTFQLANDIIKQFESYKANINIITTIMPLITKDQDEIWQNLQVSRIGGASAFDKVKFISRKEAPDLPYYTFQKMLSGSDNPTEPTIYYDDKQNLVYRKYAYHDGEISGMIIGVCNKLTFQSLIKPKSFDGQAISFIVDHNGKIIFAPEKRYSDLYDIATSEQILKSHFELKENIKKQNNIIYTIEQDKESIIAAYNFLGINDWGLLTLLPGDILSTEVDTYRTNTMLILIIASVCFIAMILLTYYAYNKHKQELEKIAYTDSLTGGLNKAGFIKKYESIVPISEPNTYTILLLNIKNFKLINEQFGEIEGDKTLKYVYQKIEKKLNLDEFVTRSEADNYFVCLKENDKKIINNRLDAILEDINLFDGEKQSTFYRIDIQIGACVISDPSQKIATILDHTRLAYSKAVEKETLSCIFYEKSFTEKLLKEQELNFLFEDSLRNLDFKLFLQPKIRLDDGTVGGAEALVRWMHPKKGLIFPSDFIPLFESNGKICQLDLYMFERVCNLMAQWQRDGRELFVVSVNLSRQHYFHQPDFLDKFYEIACKYNVPTNKLEFELTESIFFDIHQFAQVKESIQKMHQLGFLCSLDDFGAGYSSLGLLKEFDIDTIKFDRQFFLDISTKKSKDIINSLMDLSSKLGIHTVAEGIETQDQVMYLDKAKCDMIQGYYFSKPLSVPDFEEWLKAQK